MKALPIFAIFAILATVISTASAFEVDECNQWTSCQTCLSGIYQNLCGWCSQKTSDGFQCAGLNKNGGKNNFTCNGVFSTETCQPGWECNMQNYTCMATAPGTGQTHSECEANCSSVGKTFMCNNQTHQCEVAPAGQGNSLEVCEQECSPQTHSPNTHASEPTQQTETHSPASNSPASHSPSSNSPSSSEAPQTTLVPLFKCDPATVSCVPAKAGEAGVSSLTVCEQQCKKSNNTPSDLVGLWRGFPISNGDFGVDEYDYNISASGDVQYTHQNGQILEGKATFVEQSFVLTFTDNSQQACLFVQQQTQPTTYEMIFACASGSQPPASVSAAMAGTSSAFVLLASRCVDPSICQFSLQAGPKNKQHVESHFFRALRHNNNKQQQQQEPVATSNGINDKCMAYGANCTVCLAQPECGWCSQDLEYQLPNNQTVKGSQCGGFAAAGHTPWVCQGTYSTDTCVPGWACNAATQQCVPTAPGDGNPSQQACEAGCKAKPGPPSQLVGKYRGLLINEQYEGEAGVFRLNMNASGFTETLPSGDVISGSIKNYAQYIFVTIPNKGEIACIWSPNTATDGLVEYVTWACSTPGGAIPKGFDNSMNPNNGSETIFAKCLGSDCKW